MTHLFCFGLGYSARRFGLRLAARGWDVSGTSKSEDGARALCRDGFRGVVFDGQRASADVSQTLKSATHVLLSIPPDGDGDPAIRFHGADIAESPTIEWIGYLSTVGVYGDHGGRWIDETAPVAPHAGRRAARATAESEWMALAGERTSILRLAGIYGPRRNALINLRAGTARRIVKPGQVFNRIHVADIARAIAATFAHETTGIWNVCDDEPAPPQDVVTFAASLMDIVPPPEIDFASAGLSDMARSFYATNNRISNAPLKRDLNIDLAYPTYREGLKALWAAGEGAEAMSR